MKDKLKNMKVENPLLIKINLKTQQTQIGQKDEVNRDYKFQNHLKIIIRFHQQLYKENIKIKIIPFQVNLFKINLIQSQK